MRRYARRMGRADQIRQSRGKSQRRTPQIGRHVLEERQRDGKLRATLPQPRKQRLEGRRPSRVTGAVGKQDQPDVGHRTIMAADKKARSLTAPSLSP